jgi:hypothetical protein
LGWLPDEALLPFECRDTATGLRFFSRSTSSWLDQTTGPPDRDKESLVLLSEFEQAVISALSGKPAVSSSLPPADNLELVAFVEDLTWALMRPVKDDGTRLLHFFETRAFPTPKGMRVPISVDKLKLCKKFRTSAPAQEKLVLVVPPASSGGSYSSFLCDGLKPIWPHSIFCISVQP